MIIVLIAGILIFQALGDAIVPLVGITMVTILGVGIIIMIMVGIIIGIITAIAITIPTIRIKDIGIPMARIRERARSVPASVQRLRA